MHGRKPECHLVIGLTLVAACLAAPGSNALGQRRSAPQLLPQRTVAFLRIENAPELVEQLRSTAIGRVIGDPHIQPFADHVYESAIEMFRGIDKELGVSLDQMLSIPRGEICLALVAPREGLPTVVVLLDVRQQDANARKLVEYLHAKMVERGDVKTSESYGGTKLTVLRRSGESGRQVVSFERDKTIAVTSDLALAKQMLSVWDGRNVPTLSENRQYATIMERCAGSSGMRPGLTYFVDPVGLANSATSGNVALQMGLATLEPMNLNGLRGIGGSLFLGGEQFESQHHMHFLIDAPRTGILGIIAPRSGDTSPETWVPNDVASYLTVHWDLEKANRAVASAYDHFRGPDAWSSTVNGAFGERFGVNLERDILTACEGRFTRIQGVQEPRQGIAVATLFGVKLKDVTAFQRTLAGVVGRDSGAFAERTYQGTSYHHFTPTQGSRRPQGISRNLRESYLAILGDYLLLSSSEELLQRAILTKYGRRPPLSDELDFKLNASKITRLAAGKKPVLVLFERPEVTLRASYELMQSEEAIRRLSQFAERSRLFKALYDGLREHPLPPFEELEKYFAFSGRVVTSDDTGIHSLGYTFRRD